MGAELRNDRGTPPRLARVSTDVQRAVDAGEVRLSESSPSATRFRRAGRGSVEVITFKLLSKNPGALHLWPTLRVDRQRGIPGRPQRVVRSECPPRVLREIPAACAANTVHLYRPACSRTMGNLPDDAARRLPTASYSAPSPRRRVGRGSVRAHRTRRRGRRPHEKMAIHVVTAGACGGWHPPSVRGGLTPRRISDQAAGETVLPFWQRPEASGPGP